jgi:hypothetical protein
MKMREIKIHSCDMFHSDKCVVVSLQKHLIPDKAHSVIRSLLLWIKRNLIWANLTLWHMSTICPPFQVGLLHLISLQYWLSFAHFSLALHQVSNSQSVLCRYKGTRDHFPWDHCIHFYTGYFWCLLTIKEIKFSYNWSQNFFNWQYVHFMWQFEYLIKKLPVPTMQATINLSKIKSWNALLCMLLVAVSYKFLILNTYHPDWAKMWVSSVIFRS